MPSLWANAVSSRARLRQRDAVADEQHGRLAPRIMSSAAATSSGEAPLRCAPCARRGRRHLDVVLLLEHVERHVEVHRPRPAGQHRGHRLAQRQRQHVDARRLEAALDHRADDVGEVGLVVPVDLLERAAIELLRRHVGGDRQQGRRIRQRHLQRHHDVAGAGTARGQRRDRLVAHAKIGVRHVGGDLLVARRDQLDAVARVIERIEHADVAVAANAEHVGYLVRPDTR